MNTKGISFSNLTENQIEAVKALETKLNTASNNGQETILIAYNKPV